MKTIKIQGKPWIISRSQRGHISIHESGNPNNSVGVDMDSDVKARLALDVHGFERELDRLEAECVKKARKLARSQKSERPSKR